MSTEWPNSSDLIPDLQISLHLGTNSTLPEFGYSGDKTLKYLLYDSALVWLGKWIREVHLCDDTTNESGSDQLRHDPRLSTALTRFLFMQSTEHQNDQYLFLKGQLKDCLHDLKSGKGDLTVYHAFGDIFLQAQALWAASRCADPSDRMLYKINTVSKTCALFIPFIKDYNQTADKTPIWFIKSQLLHGQFALGEMKYVQFVRAGVLTNLRLAMLQYQLKEGYERVFEYLYHAVRLHHIPFGDQRPSREWTNTIIDKALADILMLHSDSNIIQTWSPGKKTLLEKLVAWGYSVGMIDSLDIENAKVIIGDYFEEFIGRIP